MAINTVVKAPLLTDCVRTVCKVAAGVLTVLTVYCTVTPPASSLR